MKRNSLLRRIRNSPSVNYLKYLMKHKYWVAHMLFQKKMYWQGITHDMSKFRPDEFIRYSKYWSSGKKSDIRPQWLTHMHRNSHHWQYWVLMDHDGNMQALEMPEKYIVEMIADWYAVEICENGFDRLHENVFKWYNARKDGIFMHKISKQFLEDNIIVGES